MVTSIFPRVELEYGQTWSALATSSLACSSDTSGIFTCKVTAKINPPLSSFPIEILDVTVVSPVIALVCLITKFSAVSKQAA